MLFTGIFIWAIWPSSRIEVINQIQGDRVFLDEKDTNTFLNESMSYVWIYPENIGLGEKGLLTLEIKKEFDINNAITLIDNGSTAIEVDVEAVGVMIEPAKKTTQILNNLPSQMFRIYIIPEPGLDEINGNIWVKLIRVNEDGNFTGNIPLLAIPLKVGVRTLMGISTNCVIVISLSTVLCMVAVIVFGKILDRTYG